MRLSPVSKEYACISAFAFTLACSGSTPAQRTIIPMGRTPVAEGEAPPWKQHCSREGEPPVLLSYLDAPGGASVHYTTAGDPAYVRERVTEVARYHNAAAPIMGMHDLANIPHTAMVQNLEDGIALTLFTSDRRHMEELRVHVQQDVWIMRRRGCGAGQEAL